ncbi:GntR family transcriptional regulator [Lacimicrobium alkaliphilum]|uniref:Transcriptional regulator n=1 Tax=Lacimicrobium alkaliphilum TaxID=1526571 RepID=A0ABQ1R9Z2_9ALTE|nr:GntR family transcriptional regulator [Lacimicrobium alkaliphilum]GGD61180.1 transcriptional regulator [Lacimicrobium alkaliphilum]
MANLTISDKIYNQLSAQIISGEIKPGQKLEEQDIANQFGVSRTPIREAFRLLHTSGLVESKAHRGVTVIELDIEQLGDMYEALQELEALCARLSAERMTAVERKQIERMHQQSKQAVEEEDVERFAELNDQLHSAIHQGSRNKTLLETIAKMRKRLTLYRQPWLFEKRNRLETSFSEHGELVDAILKGDKDKAFEAMRNHISNTSLGTLDYLMSQKP